MFAVGHVKKVMACDMVLGVKPCIGRQRNIAPRAPMMFSAFAKELMEENMGRGARVHSEEETLQAGLPMSLPVAPC
jgi:hypothetical protein